MTIYFNSLRDTLQENVILRTKIIRLLLHLKIRLNLYPPYGEMFEYFLLFTKLFQ